MNARAVAAMIGLALGIGVTAPAGAVDFSVYPVKVELRTGQQTAMLSLHNDSAQPLRLQVRAFAWEMDADGQWKLTPTDDLIVTPELLEVPPGQAAQLRVGTLLSPGAAERAYRLLLDELPGSDEDNGKAAVRLRMLTRINLPVFLEPAGDGAAALRVTHSSVRNGRLTLVVRNDGNVRFDPRSVQVDVRDANGRGLFDDKPMLGYLLPGAQTRLEVAMPARDCAAAAVVSLSAGTDAAGSGERVDDKSCASVSSSAP